MSSATCVPVVEIQLVAPIKSFVLLLLLLYLLPGNLLKNDMLVFSSAWTCMYSGWFALNEIEWKGSSCFIICAHYFRCLLEWGSLQLGPNYTILPRDDTHLSLMRVF